MARSRDPFLMALSLLRAKAIGGSFRSGVPVVIIDEAREIGLSTTPVREALAWLGGEGLVERGAAGGYSGLRIDPHRLVGRYNLRLRLLLSALDATVNLGEYQAGSDTDDILDSIAAACGDVVLLEAFRRVNHQLAPMASVEADVLASGRTMLDAIRRHQGAGDRQALAASLLDYHAERVAASAVLAAEIERRSPILGDLK